MDELETLRKKIAELEVSEDRHKQTEEAWNNIFNSISDFVSVDVAAIVHIARDISGQKRVEEELRSAISNAEAEKAKSEAIIAAIGDGISIQDTSHRILYQNQTHKDIVGDHAGEYCYMAYEKREQICEGCPVAMSFKDGEIHTIERSAPADKGILIVEVTASPLRDPSGKIIAGIEVVRDITERKKTEEELRIRDWAIKSSINAIVLSDLDANLTYVNPAFLKLWGYESEIEVLGMHCTKFWLDKGMTSEILKILQETGKWMGERVALKKDGSLFEVDLSASMVTDEAGKPICIMASLADISGRKRAEDEKKNLQLQFLQSQKLESLGRLAGGVAHDFNNLLSSILGYAELALMNIPEKHPLKENLTIIRDAGERAAALTRQLLAFSRKQTLEMQTVGLNGIIENTVRMLSRMIGVDIMIKLNMKAAGYIFADPGQIEQLLMNLSVNARDAMPNGGRLIIKTADIKLDEEYAFSHEGVSPGPYVLLSVTDTGSGISPEVQEKIFEPFFTTKEIGKGTGLGLATVYGIVKQHNGHICVYSETGEGTTFKIYLPAVQGCIQETEKQKPVQLLKGEERILVLDDNPAIRRLVVDTLGPLGYRISEASSGKEALQIINTADKNISLLLTDVVMPEMNGYEVAEAVRIKRPEIKVVFMSGYSDESIAGRGVLRSGINFIQKPLTPNRLSVRLREVLDKRDGN